MSGHSASGLPTPLNPACPSRPPPELAPVLLMSHLRGLLLAFCQGPTAAPAWASSLGQPPLLAWPAGSSSATRRACRAALQFLTTAARIEEKLARPVPEFTHAEALLDWYVKESLHRMELET